MTRRSLLDRPTACIALAAALLIAAPSQRAAATPPDVVTVTDTFFGASETHLFVLRSTSDNLGSHYEQRTETWLVAIEAATGEEILWPVHGVTQTTVFGEGDDSDYRLLMADVNPDAVDPFEVMTARGGLPMLGRQNPPDARDDVAVRSAGKITISYGSHSSYVLPIAESLAQFSASIAAMGERVEDSPRTGMLPTREYYSEMQFAAEQCVFAPVGWPIYALASEQSWQPMRVTCTDDDVMENSSLIQIARQKAPDSDAE